MIQLEIFDFTDMLGFKEMFGYKIHNQMTDENTFILSDSEEMSKKYGRMYVNIIDNYDEDTIDEEIATFYDILPKSVIVTDPEYTSEKRIGPNKYRLDTGESVYIATIIGDFSSRF